MNKEILMANAVSTSTIRCKCGHSITFLPSTKETVCSHCGLKVQNKSLTRFRYLLGIERFKKDGNINCITNN